MEVYALEIQMYTEQKNNKKLKALYYQVLAKLFYCICNFLILESSHQVNPLILGVIREFGGKMHLSEREFEKVRMFKL